MADIEIRPATDAELALIYGAAEHWVGSVDGQAVAWVSFRAIGDRTWGLFGLLSDAAVRDRRRLFYAFRKVLCAKDCVIHAAANDALGERFMRAIGLRPTGETYAGKKVFQWIPERSSS